MFSYSIGVCMWSLVLTTQTNFEWGGGVHPCSATINLSIIYQSSIYLLSSSGVFIRASFTFRGFPGGSDGKMSDCNAGDPGSIPESGRSPGEGNGNLLQYSCLKNSMD